MRKSKIAIIGVIFVVVIFITIVVFMNFNTTEADNSTGKEQSAMGTRSNMSNLDYRTDIEPISSRLTMVNGISKVYWKSDTIGSGNFGPTSYFFTGFMLLESEVIEELTGQYDWEEAKVSFPKGLNPNITEYKEFEWCYNHEFEQSMLENEYMGQVYFDLSNGIIYFYCENI